MEGVRENLDVGLSPLYSLSIRSPLFTLTEGQTYLLQNQYTNGVASASYNVFNVNNSNYYNTNATITGQFTITHLDTKKKIVSGTFYFNAVNNLSSFITKLDTIHVTDGRFDLKYQ